MTKREIVLNKLQSKSVIYLYRKSCIISYTLCNDGRTVHKTRHSDNGNLTEEDIDFQSALKQLTKNFLDIMFY